MARRVVTHKGNTISVLCFISLVASSVCFILQACGVGTGILGVVANICLLIAVIWSGMGFARSLGRTWYIVYWVFAVIAIVATLFGTGFIKLG